MNSKSLHYSGIDLVKFICSIMVVMLHVALFSSVSPQLHYWVQQYFCRIAVPFFFLTSGFFLFRKMSSDGIQLSIVKPFLFKLVRLYLIWSAIYLPITVYLVIKDHSEGYLHYVFGYIRNFLFVGSYTQLWFLNGLIIATILVTLLLFKKVPIEKILIISFVFYLIGMLFGQAYFGLIKGFVENNFLWKVYLMTFLTTRNGWFFGFFFVALGASIALNNTENKYSKKASIMGFSISMLVFLVEAILVKYFKLIEEHDMYLFLIPAVYFLFYLAINIEINNDLALHLRKMSQLVFYLHLFVAFFVDKLFELIGAQVLIENSILNFFSILLVTLLLSELIIKLSNTEKLQFLKVLYS